MSGSIDLTATIVQVKPHTRTALYFIKLLIRGYLNVYKVYRIRLRCTAIIVLQEEEKIATTAPFFSSFIFTDVKFDKNFYSQIATHRFQESDPSSLQRFQESDPSSLQRFQESDPSSLQRFQDSDPTSLQRFQDLDPSSLGRYLHSLLAFSLSHF
jgi:hypothetical protein